MNDCPQRGDFITCVFDNTKGHEQADYRRALVLSPGAYNKPSSLAIVCPVTTKKKGYPFEVAIPLGLQVTGVVLADQVRTIDWNARSGTVIEQAPPQVLEKVQSLLSKLVL